MFRFVSFRCGCSLFRFVADVVCFVLLMLLRLLSVSVSEWSVYKFQIVFEFYGLLESYV